MSFVISAVAFLLLLTVLVLIHELGHFTAARKAKVTVEEFGFGLPPRAKTLFWQGGTRFSLNWVPFGGFVRLKGENAANEKARRAKGSFGSASVPWRVVILSAGVFMNFLFAMVILTGGFWRGNWIPTYTSFDELMQAAERHEVTLRPGVRVEKTIPGGTAAEADVPFPSILLKVNGRDVLAPRQVSDIQTGKEMVTYTIKAFGEGAQPKDYVIAVKDGKTGVELQLAPDAISAPDRTFVDAVRLSLHETKVMSVQTVLGIGKLFRSLISIGGVPEGITGIVGIAQLTHASVQDGWSTYLRLVALLSLSLAILNILPLPALDGGRLMFVLIEAVIGKPLNRRFEMTTNAVGFALILVLIVLITYHDVISLL